ncbi:MAG TPA: fused MFS/spermidine synthase [Candidatus Acidoferrum sp.]|nr:fused MFS/spermidine synthase [Candidatus Acidoferrum sp.]
MSRSQERIILVCFFLSGVAGLVYEVAWTKALGLVFGHTVYAITAVLAAFMAGLAAGSAYLGKWGGRQARPVTLYGWIEVGIGITGVLSLLGLTAVRALYAATYHFASGSVPVLETLRFAGSILVLFLPTFLMGGTLPILVAGVGKSSSELRAKLGQLYWINTAGAVLGALAAGFLFLPWAGLRMTVALAAVCNVLAGSLALALARSPEQPALESTQEGPVRSRDERPMFLLVSFALVGATAMAYEISWTRALATTLGSSTYSFTIMLATFLAGIALGSRLFEIWVRRNNTVSVATFGETQVFTGIGAVVFLVLFARMPVMAWWMMIATHKSFRGLLLTQFAISGLAMLPAATAFGFNFPLVTSLIASKEERGSTYSRGVGQACAANTVGAILGCVATGFWLVPRLGAFRTVALAAGVNIALAVFLLMRSRPRRMVELAGSFALAGIVAVAGASRLLYDPAIANFNVAQHPRQYSSRLSADQIAHAADLLYFEDGLNATIAVERDSGSLRLTTNGKTDASTADSVSQLMLGHLGMVFHKAPRKVLVIGFGSGMTASAVARYSEVEQIDCVEIEPAVFHAAPYLQDLNRGVLNDPRLHIILDDARNFLFTTRNRYDVIISEPSNPWIAGVAALFTDEFYEEVRSRLAPGGVFVQWVQAYELFPQDVKMILGTLAPHFSQVSVWRGSLGDLMMLSQGDPGQLSLDRLGQLWSVPALRSDYAMLGLSEPEALIAYHMLDDGDLRRLVGNGARNTDDRTSLEYQAPLAVFGDDTTPVNLRMFRQGRSALLPTSILLGDKRESLLAAARTSLFLQDAERAGLYISELAKASATAETELLRGDWLVAARRPEEARAAYASAARLDPSSIPARMGLAAAALRVRDYDGSERILREILERQQGYLPAFEIYALVESGRGNWKEALAWQTKRVLGDPSRPFNQVLFLGDLLIRNGENRDAERLYVELLERDPYRGEARSALSELYFSEKRWEEARRHLEVLVRYFPAGNPIEYVHLADAYRKMGRIQDAEYCLLRGKKVFPNAIPPFRTDGPN